MTYGVFTLHSGRWNFVATYTSRSSAEQEIAYLVKHLGLDARLFVKD